MMGSIIECFDIRFGAALRAFTSYKHKHEFSREAICVADCDLSRVTIP